MAIQQRSVISRTAIITAAAHVFVRRGYAASTIALISDEAGLTKGAIYFHFSSKDLIARAVIEKQQETIALISAGFDMSQSSLAILVLASRDLGMRMQSDIVVRAGLQLAVEVGVFGDPVTSTYADWSDMVRALVQGAIDQGDVRKNVDPEVFVRFFISAFTGIQIVSGATTDLEDIQLRINDLWEVVLPGVVPPARVEAVRRPHSIS